MSAVEVFNLAFPVAVPFWALMILLPGWSWTKRIIGSPLMIVPSLIVYFIAVAPIFPEFAREMLNPDHAGVVGVIATPAGITLVWAHLIAFDLFIGRWMYLDSRERRVHPLVMAPILVLTILLSPFGLAAYLVARWVGARQRKPEPVG
ncbi:ABA4-like family protein [Catelliglobosispora koreensis]|uniref:ABA4-like family protein n=1 Tax=Catelliglobosispora koreensis TaxID=129052 RepID=UPI000363DA82|nr:ABA4-like family protein [Catelliglobosispora koreensis]